MGWDLFGLKKAGVQSTNELTKLGEQVLQDGIPINLGVDPNTLEKVDKLESIIQGLSNFGGGIYSAGLNFAGNLCNGIGVAWAGKSLKDGITKAGDSIGDGIQKGLTGAGDAAASGLSEAAQQMAEGTKDLATSLIQSTSEGSRALITASENLKETGNCLERAAQTPITHLIDIGPNAERTINHISKIGITYFGGKALKQGYKTWVRRDDSFHLRNLVDPFCGGLQTMTPEELKKFQEGSWNALNHLEEDGKTSQHLYRAHYARCFHERNFSIEEAKRINELKDLWKE